MYRLRLLAVAALLAGCSTSTQHAPTTTFPEPYYSVLMGTAVLTQPDVGSGGATVRWQGPEVTYRLQLPDYPAEYQDLVRRVLQWGGDIVGLQMIESSGPAQIEVVPKDGNGAVTTAWAKGRVLDHVKVELGCCRTRPAVEDGLQAFGALGDRADGRSVFSQDLSAEWPSPFDVWVLEALYALPPGSPPLAVAAELEASAREQDPKLAFPSFD